MFSLPMCIPEALYLPTASRSDTFSNECGDSQSTLGAVRLDDAGLPAVHPAVDGAKFPRPGKVYSSAQQFLGGSLFWQCGFLRPPGRQQHVVSARRRIAICGRTEAGYAESCAFQPRYSRPKGRRANSFLMDAASMLAAVSSSIVPCELGGNC